MAWSWGHIEGLRAGDDEGPDDAVLGWPERSPAALGECLRETEARLTLVQAKASLQPFMHHMLEQEVKEPAFRNASSYDRAQFLKCSIDVLPGSQGRSYLREHFSTSLWLLMAITGAVLLMACANMANLAAFPRKARQREIAIRLAGRGSIGADRAVH